MSTASKFFRSAIAADMPSRISQQGVLAQAGPNRIARGDSSGKVKSDEKKSKPFIVGETVIGGDEVVG